MQSSSRPNTVVRYMHGQFTGHAKTSPMAAAAAAAVVAKWRYCDRVAMSFQPLCHVNLRYVDATL